MNENIDAISIPVMAECSNSELSRFTSLYNGIKFANEVNSNQITQLVTSDEQAHDGTLLKIGSTLYAIYCKYEGTQGDAAVNQTAKVILTKCGIDGTNKEDIIIAQSGNTYAGVEQTGGAGSPNGYVVEDKIYILYTANMANTYCQMVAKYDVGSGTLTYNQVLVDDEVLNNTWINQHYNKSFSGTQYLSAQANCSIGDDGFAYYIGWVYRLNNSGGAIIFKSTDFVNWQIYYEYDEAVAAVYEMPIAYINNTLCFAIRPRYAGYGIYGQINDGKKLINLCYYSNCSSRPTFIIDDNVLYLVTNPQDRNKMQMIRIDRDFAQNSLVVADCQLPLNYPSFVLDRSDYTMYVLRSNNHMEISKFHFYFTRDTDAQAVFANSWSLT
ncbi:MAG: hypothetical protein IJ157_04840 [Clostridia bacterium]|nr:hypothetical protein [Clostridia bacterium]